MERIEQFIGVAWPLGAVDLALARVARASPPLDYIARLTCLVALPLFFYLDSMLYPGADSFLQISPSSLCGRNVAMFVVLAGVSGGQHRNDCKRTTTLGSALRNRLDRALDRALEFSTVLNTAFINYICRAPSTSLGCSL